MNKINRVLIAGGTHGNELTGIYLVKKFEQNPELVKRASFETVLLLGNPCAMTAGLRYIDQDLNRCFNLEDRQTEDADSAVYEVQRAIEIREQFGLAGRTPVDFAIDIHSTSANAGMMLILDNSSQFVLRLAAHLSTIEPILKVYSSAQSGREQDALRSLAKYRLCIEVGPICHGTLHAELFTKTEALIQAILSYLDQSNQADIQLDQQQLTVYQYCRAIDYPRNNQGEIIAAIHPQLHNRDYAALNPGDPIFLTFDQRTIVYQGDSTVYPVFVNEAAYYEKGIAMCLTTKQQIQLD